jgi:hypothetical protein
MKSPCSLCLCLCILSFNFFNDWPILYETSYLYHDTLAHLNGVFRYFIYSFHQSMCLYLYRSIVGPRLWSSGYSS